jgi:hypothetical protein
MRLLALAIVAAAVGCSRSPGEGTPDLGGVGGVGESDDMTRVTTADLSPPPDLSLPGGGETTDLLPPLDLLPPPDLAPPPPIPGVDKTVTLFDRTLFSWDGQADHRENTATVNLPVEGAYRKITLHLQLQCPAGGCDPYDRLASLGVIAANGQIIEIGRFATPFGVGGAWDIDVTDLRPLLSGYVQLKGFVDTWVGNGKGWLLTATLKYVGGIPTNLPVAVVPLRWGNLNIGDPAYPPVPPPAQVTLPAGASRAAVRLFVSGHGQGNKNNCAEFCSLQHTVSVDGLAAEKKPLWRNDCGQNPINNQAGTWQYNRAGWCPGADVKPWRVDLGPRSGTFKVGYGIDSYVNSCSPALCSPADCVFKTSCAYDGGAHTQPYYALSAVVIAYR